MPGEREGGGGKEGEREGGREGERKVRREGGREEINNYALIIIFINPLGTVIEIRNLSACAMLVI